MLLDCVKFASPQWGSFSGTAAGAHAQIRQVCDAPFLLSAPELEMKRVGARDRALPSQTSPWIHSFITQLVSSSAQTAQVSEPGCAREAL